MHMCILFVDWRLVLLCIRVSDSDLFTVLVLLDLSGFDWFFPCQVVERGRNDPLCGLINLVKGSSPAG